MHLQERCQIQDNLFMIWNAEKIFARARLPILASWHGMWFMAGFVLACIFLQTFISKAFKMKNQIMDINQRELCGNTIKGILYKTVLWSCFYSTIYRYIKLLWLIFFLIPTKRKFIIFWRAHAKGYPLLRCSQTFKENHARWFRDWAYP